VQTQSIGACGWYDIDAADLDNDGDMDVIITEWLGCINIPESSRRIFISLNNGNAVFSNPIIKLVGSNPGPIGTGDFNLDGKMDVVTGVSGAKIELNPGTGNGDLMPPTSFSIGSQGGATDIVVQDFNNNGKLDIASCNFWETSTMSLLYGNGNGTFQTAVILPSAHSPDLLNVSGITAGDLDNDGDKDIMVGHNASNCISLYYNNSGTFEYKMRAGGYSGVYAPLFADFNGDNKGDIVAIGSIPPSGMQSNLMFIRGINTGIVSISGNMSNVVNSYSLGQNYPNPFNPVTKISLDLPKDGLLKFMIYDITGRLISTLENEMKTAGSYNVTFDGSSFSSGVYFYKLEAHQTGSSAGSFIQTKRMLLIK
jgi:hypothetical protein